ncbi:uncharacterized protein LOC133802006 [Humulus lupulus]|uniref:uncharacterized protein LOC133802006 n=1 Tax=Humulus lupulus TaxID=3486 RepID=UPI002B40E269|nr:uncharacterized protein LOC133802006 [Humulus lupulus]
MASFIERPFLEDEIRQAVFDCDGSKAPGLDGFFNDGVIHGRTNEIFTCLIPKKLNSCRVRDFRPISLYKIISKVLAYIGFEEFLQTQLQGAFVEGRQILDTILIANEAGFLDLVLDKKGFGEVWRKWMRGCLSSMSFSIFLNGRPRGNFKGSRGLRQGDSLSPLFTLVVDVLGRMIDKGKSVSAFRDFIVGKDKVDVSHLQFVDDTMFFAHDDESLAVLLDILKVFSIVSGLSINLQKCQLLRINLWKELVDQKASGIGCEVGQWPIQYLGRPLGASPRSKVFWEPVVSNCAKRLDSWKSAFMSRGGRLTLIQSVLSSIPVYYLSLFRIPKSVAGVIEKRMRDFLWEGTNQSGGDHLLSWLEVCKSRSHGGLGIGNLVLRNKAFLMK